MTDTEFAILKRLVENQDRDTAHATVAPVDTAQYRSPRSLTPGIPSDVCVHMEKKEAGMMDPEQISSNHHRLGRVLKHPDSSVPRTGRQDESLPTLFARWHGFK